MLISLCEYIICKMAHIYIREQIFIQILSIQTFTLRIHQHHRIEFDEPSLSKQYFFKRIQKLYKLFS